MAVKIIKEPDADGASPVRRRADEFKRNLKFIGSFLLRFYFRSRLSR